MKTPVGVLAIAPVCAAGSSAQTYDARSRVVAVPAGPDTHIATDGVFSTGEWDGALSCPVGDDYRIYLKASSEAR